MLQLSKFYNHNSFKKSVAEGTKIIANTDFKKYKNQRINAITNFNVNDIINDNGSLAKIINIIDDTIVAIPLSFFTKTGKLKKQYSNHGGYFYNPCLVQKIN